MVATLNEMGSLKPCMKQVQFFSQPPSFDALLSRCREKFMWAISLRGRFDCEKERAHYVLMALSCEDE